MTTEEKEKIVETWPYPWPEYASLLRRFRDESLKAPDRSPDERREIQGEYERELNRLFERKSS